jgi:hypothetical protein
MTTRQSMHRNVSNVVIGILAALSVLARRFRHIHWLQVFRFERLYDSSRDRHLDTAWKDGAPRGQGRHDTPREPVTAFREQFRAYAAELPQLPKERKAKLQRSSNVFAGIQLILLGIALPFGYHFLSVMSFFSEVSTMENVVVFAAAGGCIALGFTVIWRSGKD